MNRFALVRIGKTVVIKNNFQAFKILQWPVLASLKIEKKGIKVLYSRQLRTSSNRLFYMPR